ncbi:hypothetical protein [Flavobacterium branchiophilum]|uniref:Uncharacterized protein n=1 Tax=Flavobacterium branchiophilum TaxID=55197 RepID=A0A2H3KMM4_9FLAO|nr:hypothetical protein [Flavobacterium branchiophilum]PDS21704.1 hypothetical protein B0A77_15280 [Flavobacterium branchiophilum]
MKKIILIILFYSVNICFSQNNYENISIDKLLKIKTLEDQYDFGWLPTEYGKTPFFRNYTYSKIQWELVSSKNDSVIYTSKNETK